MITHGGLTTCAETLVTLCGVDMDDFRSRLREFAHGLRARTTGEPLHPTGWEWFSDVMLGIAMAFAVLNSRPHHGDAGPHLFYETTTTSAAAPSTSCGPC